MTYLCHFHILIELPLIHISYVTLEAKGGGTNGTVVKVHLHLLSLKRKSKRLEFKLIVNNPAHLGCRNIELSNILKQPINLKRDML